MTDDGANEQPVPEAPPSAPASPLAPATDAPAAEAPDSAVLAPGTPAEAAQVDAPPAEIPPAAEPAATVEPPPVDDPIAIESSAGALSANGTPAQTDALTEVTAPAPAMADAPRPEDTALPPAAALAPPVATPPATRGVPPMLGFASWRLVELVVTVAAATMLFALLLPAGTAADAGILAERLGVTVPLVILAVLVAIVVGLPIGYAAARVGSWLDVGLRALATMGAGLAPIWLAMLLVLLLSTTLRWLQPAGFVPWLQSPLGALLSLVLPALALGLPLAAELALRMRDALRVAQADPAIRSAEIMGFTRAQAIRAHAVRNALADLTSRAALPLALLVPASLIIENVFYLPGLGRLIFTALEARDFGALQMGLTALVALIALTRFTVQLLHAAADPRLARRA